MPIITIQVWDENAFTQSHQAWTALLENSDSDRLFMSWEWLHTWWQVFANPGQMHLRIFAAVDEQNNLMGIAPLYLSSIKTTRFLRTRRLQFIGNCWRVRDTMRTELLDFIVDKKYSNEVIRAFCSHIQNLREWDEFILVNIRKTSDLYRILINEACLPGCYLRKAESYASYYLNTKGDFRDYLQQLSKSTRLNLFNRRKLLHKIGKVNYSQITKKSIDDLFETLNRLHNKRWGYEAFADERLKFNKIVAELFDKKGELCFSILYVDGLSVSIQYNYKINAHIYNIQAGFDPNFHKKVALGYLHFGFEIEHAYQNDTVIYDFLAGEGKNTPYKERLTKTWHDINDMHIVRNIILQLLYRTYDWISKFRRVTD